MNARISTCCSAMRLIQQNARSSALGASKPNIRFMVPQSWGPVNAFPVARRHTASIDDHASKSLVEETFSAQTQRRQHRRIG
jgi:hypothetical protein